LYTIEKHKGPISADAVELKILTPWLSKISEPAKCLFTIGLHFVAK